MKTNTSTFAAMDRAAYDDTTTVFARIGSVLRSIAMFPQRRAVREELSQLSDRELADIGLMRSDIAHVFDARFNARRGIARRSY